jgi:hypothetical protein
MGLLLSPSQDLVLAEIVETIIPATDTHGDILKIDFAKAT